MGYSVIGYTYGMPRERLLRFLGGLIAVIVLFHLTAIRLDLYWNLWWFDIFLHLMGGAWLSLALLWLIYYSGYIPAPHRPLFREFLLVMFLVLAIGILWEVFEWSVGATFAIEGYWLDTMSDIACDVAGGLAGCLMFSRYFSPTHA